MAKPNHTCDEPEAINRQPVRFLTVSLYPESQPRIPWIRLRGRWLAQAGFMPHSRVKLRVMIDCLVITRES